MTIKPYPYQVLSVPTAGKLDIPTIDRIALFYKSTFRGRSGDGG